MRFLLTLAALAALTVSAFAQNGGPKEVGEIATIKLYPGETRIFTFDQPISDIKSTGENVKIIPETDRTFAFIGISPGTVILSAFNADAHLIHRSRIIVHGGLVRIYGTLNKEDTKDYVGYVCSDGGCGRADPDLDKTPASSSITVTRPNRRGGSTSVTKNY